MNQKYKQLIEMYCKARGISIPSGFYRHSPSHFIVVRSDSAIPKLVAKTFFKKEDLNYYIKNNLLELSEDEDGFLPAKVVNFKDQLEYRIASTGRLSPIPLE